MHVLTVSVHESSPSMLRCVTPGLEDLQDMSSMKRTFQQAHAPGFSTTDRLLYEARGDLDREDALGADVFSSIFICLISLRVGRSFLGTFNVAHRAYTKGFREHMFLRTSPQEK
ncbi:hypothetical protein PTI98_000083 [Pleurotus ostreatus]|nr:hypothetical protein PTI98_000083 [Pleurotus ostreatus]